MNRQIEYTPVVVSAVYKARGLRRINTSFEGLHLHLRLYFIYPQRNTHNAKPKHKY